MKILKNKLEIQEVFNGKKYFSSKYFTIFVKEVDSESKILVTTIKKYGNAVERNRVKRQVKEIIFNSEMKENIHQNKNYIFVCKKEIKNLDEHSKLLKQVDYALKGVNKNEFKQKQ